YFIQIPLRQSSRGSSNIIERVVAEFVQFINAHQPVLLVFILIDESSRIGVSSKKQHVFNVLNAKPLEIAFFEFIELVIISTHSDLIQMLVVMPFDDLKFSDSDDSTFGVDISSRLPVDWKTIELLMFTPSMRDSPESIFIIADRYLTPHRARLLQERIRAPLDSCMMLSSARRVDELKLGKLELDKMVLGKLEVGFDLAFSAVISVSKEEVIELDDLLRWAEVSQSLWIVKSSSQPSIILCASLN
nr:hypothetical protein [Tanacetum cinerariifolium]